MKRLFFFLALFTVGFAIEIDAEAAHLPTPPMAQSQAQ